MWILKILPDFVFHLIFLLGILGLAASFVLKFVPFISQYQMPIQVAASILIIVGAYMEGGISDNAAWEAKVADLKLQVARAEAASADANAKLTQTLADNRAKIVAAQSRTKQNIQKNARAIDKECKLNDISIQLYNQAVTGVAK
jgi:hypothetical protein